MTYLRGNVHYVKRKLHGIGQVEKSLRTRNAGRARQLEDMILTLHERGRLDLLRAWLSDELTISRLAEAYEAGRMHELSGNLRNPDVDLQTAVDAALKAKRADVKGSTLQRYRTGLEHFARLTEAATVRAALTTDTVREFKAARRAEGAAKETVNNDLQAVSILASYALERGWIRERPKINKFPSSVRISWLDAGQIRLYMANLPPEYRPLMEFLIATGVRLGEAENLRVSDLRFGREGTEALIRDAKTPESERTVFVPAWSADTLKQMIEARALGERDRLFPIPRRTVQKAHATARTQAGLGDYTIHDHRHTAAVHLAKAGTPLNLIQQQLGHANIRQTMRYARFHPDYGDVGEYMDRMGERLGLSGDTSRDIPGVTPDSATAMETENETP